MATKTITIKGVLEDLNNGLTRADIGEKYGITKQEVKFMFTHEKLKNRKTKKKFVPSFELVDDTVEQTNDAQQVVDFPDESVTEEPPADNLYSQTS